MTETSGAYQSAVLFVMNSLEVGGSELKIVRTANALAQTGIDAEIAYMNAPETLIGQVDPSVRTTNLRRRGKYSLLALCRLRRLARDRDLTIVSVNMYPLLYALPAVRLFPRDQSRVICLVNTVDLVASQRHRAPIYVQLLRRCDTVVFACEALRRSWTTTCALQPKKTTVIYNGVDEAYFQPLGDNLGTTVQLRQYLGIPEGAIVFGSVGRLAPEKQFDLLLNAVARLNSSGRPCYAVLIGQGRERTRLEQLARQLSIEGKVRFAGLLEDVRPALALLDGFVLPSASEAFSNAALEAMAMGRPVVLSDTGGAGEMVQNGKSGLVFPTGDIDALERALIMLHDSTLLREQLGDAARRRVLQGFRFVDMVDRYRSLVSNPEQA